MAQDVGRVGHERRQPNLMGRDKRDERLDARWDLDRSVEAARYVAARRVGGDLNIVAAYVDLDRREAGVDQCRHFLMAVFFCW